MKRFLYVILGGLLVPLLGVLFTSSYVSAATPWDNLGTTDDMSIYQTQQGEKIDLGTGSSNYIYFIENSNDPACSGVVQSLQQAWDTGAWSISMYDNGAGTPRNFVLSWNENLKDNQKFIYWDTGNANYGDPLSASLVTEYVDGYPQGSVVISYYNSEVQVQCSTTSATSMPIVANKPGWFAERAWLVFTTYELEYPEEYEGEILPDTWSPPVSFDTEKITIEWNSDDNKLNIRDTTDYYEGFTQCFIQLPVNKQGDNFIEYHYDCQVKPWIEHDLPEIDQQFTAIVWVKVQEEWFSKSFTLPLKAGEKCNSELGCESDMLKNLLNDCLDTTFPFLHIDECGNFFYYLSNQLTFDRFNIGGVWTTGATCRQLGTIGDWIHRPNQTICPQFSKEVRDTVTPFITFMLGLLTVRFIISRTGMGT